ncbi:MAG: hypothetical protein C0183_21905 [Roseiflexus castenholzii]|nr:MAG: hypothetical protein C0183_21905 [Roseiflexus castenholzii]
MIFLLDIKWYGSARIRFHLCASASPYTRIARATSTGTLGAGSRAGLIVLYQMSPRVRRVSWYDAPVASALRQGA